MTLKSLSESNKDIHMIQLFSRQNELILLPDTVPPSVIKKFTLHEHYEIEKRNWLVLNKAGIRVPELLEDDKESCLLYSYVPGETLLEVLEQSEECCDLLRAEEVLTRLFLWLKECYTALRQEYRVNMILDDIHLRNFIYCTDGSICGVDFEDVRTGEPIEDVGQLCAFVLMYSPAFTEYKFELCRIIYKQAEEFLFIDRNTLLPIIKENIMKIAKRRNTLIDEKQYHIICERLI
jgi:hypothetical protein